MNVYVSQEDTPWSLIGLGSILKSPGQILGKLLNNSSIKPLLGPFFLEMVYCWFQIIPILTLSPNVGTVLWEPCQPKTLYLTKLSFKNEEEIKTFLHKQMLGALLFAHLPTRNAKGSSSGWNEKTLDSNLRPYKEIKNSGEVMT